MPGLIFRHHFDAAHKLPGYKGPCARLHGHRWIVELTIEGEINFKGTGMIIDFKLLKKALEKILPDHRYINEVWKFRPTAENIASHIYFLLSKDKKIGPMLLSVTVWESPDAAAIFP
jgi:6-pyruvoyltetrahydropterin/6-carboxytetrahydropterin synthase